MNQTPEVAKPIALSAHPHAVDCTDKAMPEGNAQVDRSVQSNSVGPRIAMDSLRQFISMFSKPQLYDID